MQSELSRKKFQPGVWVWVGVCQIWNRPPISSADHRWKYCSQKKCQTRWLKRGPEWRLSSNNHCRQTTCEILRNSSRTIQSSIKCCWRLGYHGMWKSHLENIFWTTGFSKLSTTNMSERVRLVHMLAQIGVKQIRFTRAPSEPSTKLNFDRGWHHQSADRIDHA